MALLLSSLMGDWNTIRLASNGIDALQKISEDIPDVVLADIDLIGMSGADLCNVLKSSEDFRKIRIILIATHVDEYAKIHCSEVGAQALLSKDQSPEDIITQIKAVVHEQQNPELDEFGGLTGYLAQMNLVELVQSMDMNAKTGRLSLQSEEQRGTIFFERGKVVDAQTGQLRGDRAVFRMLSWEEGSFSFANGITTPEKRVLMKAQSLVLEGLRQYDEKKRLIEDLPDLRSVFKPAQPLSHLIQDSQLDRYEKQILIQFRGTKTLQKILERNEIGDLETLQAFYSLIKRKIVIPDEDCDEQSRARMNIAPEKTSQPGQKIKTSQGFFGNVDEQPDQADDHKKS